MFFKESVDDTDPMRANVTALVLRLVTKYAEMYQDHQGIYIYR